MSEINEDDVVHVDIVGKCKVYSEVAYNKLIAERDRLKERIYQSIKILRGLAENVGEWADQEIRDTADGIIDGLESELLRTGGGG